MCLPNKTHLRIQRIAWSFNTPLFIHQIKELGMTKNAFSSFNTPLFIHPIKDYNMLGQVRLSFNTPLCAYPIKVFGGEIGGFLSFNTPLCAYPIKEQPKETSPYWPPQAIGLFYF
jgi:hypothetical protein